MVNKRLRCRKGEYVTFKIMKKKSPFMIYPKFESILVPEDNGEQNPNESYTNKYQRHVPSHDCKVKYVNDNLSKPYKSYCLQLY